jgi:Ca2+-binding EF-hand superfamily protein
MKTLLVTLALGAAFVSAPALAQEHHGHGDRMQQDMTRQQAQQMADEMFQRFDTNHDGTLTRDEAQQAAGQFGGRGAHMIDRMFGDAKSVTLQQAESQAMAHFDSMDLNHDGILNAAERKQARAAMRGKAGENPGQ